MTHIPWILRSLMIFRIISSVYSDEALLFNPYTLEIYDLEEENPDESDSLPCAVACPATYNEGEKEFIKNINYGDTFLRLQQVDTLLQQSKIKPKCDMRFYLSVLLHSKKGSEQVEFGFEVYFEKSQFPSEQFNLADINNFSEVSDNEFFLKRMAMSLVNRLSFLWNQRQPAISKWSFLWIPKIEVRYNFSTRILESLKYKLKPIKPDELKMTCHNYYLYGTWYNTNSHLNTLYEYENQSAIFKKVKYPEGSCKANNINYSGQCVKKHSLVLPYQFKASASHLISCSNITTIPLWRDIPDKLMDRMERFLIAVAQVLGKDRELVIISGILGTLTLPSNVDESPVKIYLDDEEKKIPVPNVIYKIVRHRTYECEEETGELCWFDVVIVIHNYPTFTTDQRLCSNDECKFLGWDTIQYLNSDKSDENKSPFVYCCKLDEAVAKSIDFPLGKTQNSVLNLKNFPEYSVNLKDYRYSDILGLVDVEFQKFVRVK